AELRGAIEAIDDKLRVLRQEGEAIAKRMDYLNEVADSIRKSLEEEASEEGYALAGTAWERVESASRDGQARVAELEKVIKTVSTERAKKQKELDEQVAELRQRAGVLRFDLSGALSGSTNLLLRYQVRDAGWQPVHEIRANPANGSVEWTYKARMWQRSGEDWERVMVTLNSASALYASGLPELAPLFLQRVEGRPLMARAKDLMQGEGVAYEMAPAAAAAVEAERSATTTGFFMNLPEVVTLESGSEPAVRPAFTDTLPADYWSEAVPALSTEAWLMAGLTNELGWPILAGESYFYIDRQLVARRHLDSISAGEEIELSLGVNENIAIERKERVKEESEGGLIDRTKKHAIKFETTVENRMPVTHRVVLQDRFPIGRDNKIQVRTIQPKDAEPEEGTGIFKWERQIPSGSKAVMTTEYIVTYPAEWTVYPPL
ncbi:MAG: mucoidy inhibitor MuiA family protein, partial [Oceanipulchritudo sp.]